MQMPRAAVFQSLLLWNGGADHGAFRRGGRSRNMFQSLLLWNGGARTSARRAVGHDDLGFNPCCCGTGGRTSHCKWERSQATGFQSLLLWNGGADLATRHDWLRRPLVSILVVVERGGGPGLRVTVNTFSSGFNPCCCGTGGGAAIALAGRVSILVVMERGADPGQITVTSSLARFQSLLLWNGGAEGQRGAAAPNTASGFNPCCCGTGVTVLPSPRGKFLPWSFNPCCCGTGGGWRQYHRSRTSVTCFNPCCCGTGGRTVPISSP